MKILVTGATGFVGQALVRKLANDGHRVWALVRKQSERLPRSVEQIIVADIGNLSSDIAGLGRVPISTGANDDIRKLNEALKETDVVIHTAARVHVMKEHALDPLSLFRRVNTEGTIALARMAADAAVKRFVFLSTIKVNGESTSGREPFSEKDVCQPDDPYAISKWEAEQGLGDLSVNTPMDVVVIRAPLIYGPGVKGNFAALTKLVDKGIPFPLASVKNQRSLLALENLISFISACLSHPKAANEVFLLSDDKDISTPELVQHLALARGMRVRLLPLPVSCIRLMALVIGKKDFSERLLGSLQVNISKAKNLIGWQPVVTMQQQLEKGKS